MREFLVSFFYMEGFEEKIFIFRSNVVFFLNFDYLYIRVIIFIVVFYVLNVIFRI